MNRIIRILEKHFTTIIFFGVVIILIIIFLFVLNRSWNSNRPIDEDVFSAVAHYIGLILSFVTIAFIYKTYLETVRQNSRIAIENSFQMIDAQITNFSFNGKRGMEAISSITIDKGINNADYYNQLTLILSLFENHKSFIDESFIFNEKAKESFLKLTWFLFYSKILWTIYYKIENKSEIFNPKNGERSAHDDFGLTIPRYCTLALESLEFLGKNGLIIIDNNHKKNVMDKLNKIKEELSLN